jgi:aminopeptidase N
LATCAAALTHVAERSRREGSFALPTQFHRRAAALCAVSLLALAGAAQAATPAKPAKPAPTTALTLSTGGQMPAEEAAVTIEHVDLKLKIIPQHKAIEGDATLTLAAKSALPRIVLDFDKNFAVSALIVDGKALPASAWTNPEGRLTITPAAPIAAGAKTVVQIRYAGQPHEAEKAPWDGGFVWKTAPTGEPWIASAVQGDGCDLFWPCIDFPTGEPLLVDFYVTVPAPLSAPAGGVLVGVTEKDGWRTFHWRQKQPDTYAIAVNVGPYVKLEDTYKSRFGDSFPIEYWYLKSDDPAKARALFAEFPTTLDFFEQMIGPYLKLEDTYKSRFGDSFPIEYWYLKSDDPAKARALFAEFPTTLDFFEQMIGPYPFRSEKLGVVETPHLGMEHQTMNAYGNDYKKDVYGYDWLFQHELSHEWFGNQVTNVDWDDMWIHEGLGSYMQPLYSQWLHGDMEYMTRLNAQRVQSKNQFPIVSDKVMTEDQVYKPEGGPANDIYAKGSNVMHTLRATIGDAAFFKAVRILVYGRPDPKPGNFAPRYATTKDFIAIVNDVTGKDYQWFFDAYFYQAKLPELRTARDGDDLVLSWKTPSGKAFPMPVEVKVGDKIVTAPMTDNTGRIKVGDAVPVIVDPASKILRRQPYLEEYAAWKKAADEAAKKAETAKPAKKK